MIGDHAERIEFGVTNLGTTNIFLGLDWLCHHNPNIDWSNSMLSFDCCPAKCSYVPWWYSPEEGEVLNRLNEDDCLFCSTGKVMIMIMVISKQLKLRLTTTLKPTLKYSTRQALTNYLHDEHGIMLSN